MTSMANINPSNLDDTINEVPLFTAAQASDAIVAATDAAAAWGKSTPLQRFEVLDRAGNEIFGRAAQLGDLLAREEGKTLVEATGEVLRAGQICKYFAGMALQPSGEAVDSIRPGVNVTVTREPVGVVSVITPWNFPIAIPAWKIAPALAYGNTVVFKPAELVPASALEFVAILQRAGVPEGVLNIVTGKGSEIGDTLTGDPRVDAVTFTGSVATGDKVLASAQAHRAKVQLEMGGKNPLVVLDDAELDIAVECALQGAFGSTGQRCTASSVLIVTDAIHDAFIAKLTERMNAFTVGDARGDGTLMGPVVDERQLEIDEKYLAIATSEGGNVLGGERLERSTPGYYLSPALVLDTKLGDTINTEEVFGPVASVIRVKDYDEALAAANTTDLNLSSGICTTSLKYSSDFRRNSKAGMVMVNLPTAGVDFHVPFGGRGASSYGPREQGSGAKEFFTVTKTAYVAP